MPTATITDNRDLVLQLKQRTHESFAELYEGFGPVLFGIIYKIVGDKTTAEDVLQDVFVKVWKNIENYDENKASLFTWLLSITRHTAIDHLRSKQYRTVSQIQKEFSNEYIEGTPVAISNETGNSGCRGLVAKLEPKYRQIIDLVYFWGYTQEEVAKMLDLPLGTVKTRARTGLQILRNLL